MRNCLSGSGMAIWALSVMQPVIAANPGNRLENEQNHYLFPKLLIMTYGVAPPITDRSIVTGSNTIAVSPGTRATANLTIKGSTRWILPAGFLDIPVSYTHLRAHETRHD